jgi:outer membrane protein TolC
MRRDRVLTAAVILFLAIPACAGYREHTRSLQRYEPPPFYRDLAGPKPVQKVPPVPADAEFESQVARLKTMQKRWEDALRGRVGGDREEFFRPDPPRLKALSPAGEDPSAAKEVLTGEFSLQDLEVLAFLRNPGVRAAEERLRASLETYSQVWNLDEIIRQYTAFIDGLMTGVGPMKGGEPVAMRFPFPGVLALKGEVVNQEVIASRETLEISRREAITLIRKSYWDLLYIRRAREITGEVLLLLGQLNGVATNRYETGKTSFQDVIKVRIEREKLAENLKTLGEQQKNLEARILETLNLRPENRLGAPAVISPSREVPPLDRLYALGREKKQELKRARAGVGKMERMIEMAETAIFPPSSLNLSIYENQAINQVGTARTKEPFGVSTPASTGAGLPRNSWYGRNDAYLRETRQKLAGLREELKGLEDQTMFAVREAWYSLDRAKREEALYADRVVKLSRAALEVSTRGYETGKVTFADVTASCTGWLNSQLALERERANLGIARAELERALGGPW